MSSIASSNNMASRQSRLVQPQPRSRLSSISTQRIITTNNNNSSTTSNTFNTKSCHQLSNATNSTTQLVHHQSAMDQYHPQSVNYSADNQGIPNANTSGLPAPRQRQINSSYIDNRSDLPGTHKIVSPIPAASIPSTIGNALRRRQPSPVVPIKQANSLLPPPNLTSNSVDSPNINLSFCVRRSQSQKPQSAQFFGNQSYKPSNSSFAIHLRTGARSKSLNKQQELLGQEQDEAKDVESLPPLKSTSYISRLISHSNKESQIDPQSEPIISTSSKINTNKIEEQQIIKPSSETQETTTTEKKIVANTNTTTTLTAKPSQSIKPLMTRSPQFREPLAGKLVQDFVSTSKFGNTFGLACYQLSCNKGQPVNRTSSLTLAPQSTKSMLPALPSSIKSTLMLDTKITADSINKGRRLSLQHSSYHNCTNAEMNGSHSLQKAQISEDGSDIEGTISNETDDEAESGMDEDHDGDDGDNDGDDATTATTMTQMSDSNVRLTTANQELNTMIQMLSSSAILGDSNCESSTNSVSSTSYENDYSKKSGTSTNSGGKQLLLKLKSQLPKVKSKVVKSQSLSFSEPIGSQLRNGRNGLISERYTDNNKTIHTNNKNNSQSSNHESPMSRLSMALQSTFAAPAETFGSSNVSSSSKQHQRTSLGSGQRQQHKNVDRKIKLPRPRSRIIFDPTSSQFHVSCTAEEEEEEEREENAKDQYSNNGQSSGNSSTDTNEDLVDTLNLEEDEQDEASIKLLDTQNQITALKYLSTTSDNNKFYRKDRESEEENDTIRRLKDCRGSLESLSMIGQQDETFKQQNEALYGSLPASNQLEPSGHRRSPVGSTLRSLFGIQSSSGGDSLDSAPVSKIKVATIVRHSSLRSDPRFFDTQDTCSIERKSSLQNNFTIQDPAAQLSTITRHSNLGSDLLQRAGKRLSASSSSLTSKFKFISSNTSSSSATTTTTTTTVAAVATIDTQPNIKNSSSVSTDGSEDRQKQSLSIGNGNRFIASPNNKLPLASPVQNNQGALQKNAGLPPRMPIYETKQGISNGISSNNNPLLMNGTNNCDHNPVFTEADRTSICDDITNYNNINGFDNDADTTILSDTSTLHEESTNMAWTNKCAELERTVVSLKDKLITKEKELTDLQLKQWSSDYLIDQLKSTINRLEKENALLKAVVVKVNRVNL